jgi:hypothetical protein
MTNAQIVALGVRLFAIWLAFYLLRHVPAMWVFGNQQPDSGFNATVVVVSVVLVLLTIALWMFPLAVARKLLPTATLDQPTPLPVEQLERAGFCLLGLWVLTEAVPRLIYAAVMFFYSRRPDPSVDLGPSYYADLIYSAVTLILGVWLLLGAKGLLGVLRWARSAGSGSS